MLCGEGEAGEWEVGASAGKKRRRGAGRGRRCRGLERGGGMEGWKLGGGEWRAGEGGVW